MDRNQARAALQERGIPFDESRLFRYVKHGDAETVSWLLAAGVDANARDGRGRSALSLAARRGHGEVVGLLVGAGADAGDLAAVLDERRKKKDGWEKLASLSAVFTFLSSVAIAGVGWYFTESYNARQLVVSREQNERDNELKAQQNRITEMETVEKMLPHLAKDEETKKAALLTISVLATPELATRMAELFGGEGSIDALTEIAATKTGKGRTGAVDALASLASKGAAVDARKAQTALGTVFAGKERALVKILLEERAVCTGFVVDSEAASIVTADYCLDLADADKYSIQTWEGRIVPAKVLAVTAKLGIGLLQTAPGGFLDLRLAQLPAIPGDQVLGIGYEMGKELKVTPGRVTGAGGRSAAGILLVAVEFESDVSGGTGGGPILDSAGDVVCMIFQGTATREQCLPAADIRRVIEESAGSRPASG